MATVTTLTKRGQVTIPREIRDRLGLKPFDTIEVRVVDGEIRLSKAPSPRGGAGSLPATHNPIEHTRASTKEERATRDPRRASSVRGGERARRSGHLRTDDVVERTAGAFKSHLPPLSAEELRKAAEQAWVEDILERMGS